jgi:AraC-like DNA-binding protein
MLKSSRPSETGLHLAQFLTDTKVTPIGEWRRPARVGGLRIGGFSFALLDLGTSMTLEATVRADHFLIVSCLRGSAWMNVDGRSISVSAGTGFVARPLQYLKARLSSDCIRLAVRIESHLLDPDKYPEHAQFAVDGPAMRPWFELVQFLLSSSLLEAAEHDPALLTSMEGVLYGLLRSNSLRSLFDSKHSPIASSDVRRAEIFIRAHAPRDISLKEIAEAAGTVPRTLQSHFMQYRHVTPMQFLRNVRLDAARDLLLSGRMQVADAAVECGFAHQSRFAHHYRRRFGESPSSTLQRT